MKITIKDRAELKNILNKFSKRKTKRAIFHDLCFALTAPQTTFKSNIKVINELKRSEFYEKPVDLFLGGFQKEKNALKELLKPVRFYNNKAKYLIGAKRNFQQVLDLVWKEHGDYSYLNNDCGYDKREWLVKNVKGLGMKAASHFLRNLGYNALAIIDTHIIKFLAKNHIDYPHFITKRWGDPEVDHLILFKKLACSKQGYEELESLFQESAGHMNLTTAELDALVWKQYSNTDWKEFKY